MRRRPAKMLAELVPPPGPSRTLTAERFPHVHPDHPLDIAMRRLARSGWKTLPVVSRDNVRELRGTISAADVLSAYATERPATADTGASGAHPRLLARMLTVLVALALLTGVLNYFFRSQRVSRAGQYYEAGNQYLAKDRIEEAIEQFRRAVSVSHNVRHRLALGLALVKAGRLEEASVYLNEVLREDPRSGPANLGMARILAQQGRTDEAAERYRQVQGAQARMELAGMLAKAGRRDDARRELLAAIDDTGEDDAARRQAGHLLLQYGFPDDAAQVFRDLLRRNRRDASAYDGLGEAESALGNVRAACSAFRSALRIEPADALAAARACR